MIGCLWTCVRKQPINELYVESETVLKFYNLEARSLNRESYMSAHVLLSLEKESYTHFIAFYQ